MDEKPAADSKFKNDAPRNDDSGTKSGGWLKPVETTPAPTDQVKPGGLPEKEK